MGALQLPIAATDQHYEIAPSKIICLGLNYREHVAESVTQREAGRSDEVPTEPVLFPKTPNVLIGDGASIRLPRIVSDYGFEEARTDYEGELAMIIGTRCKNVAPEAAMRHVLGFTCFNDVSQRNIQKGDRSGWFRGKSFDTFGPIGPRLVMREDIGDPQNLEIQTRLNGEVVQHSTTAKMIFGLAEMLSFISRNMTLEEGDVIVTGTPSGVGPIAAGDRVDVEIEGIGVLSNPVLAEDEA
jgi:2-keto-4-pentenoate hydratase/2-oxohepta-3-ene-1,7-dioic acid hydratase in catechol pathway